MSTVIRDLQAKKAASVQAASALLAVAEKDNRDLTTEEQTQYDGIVAGIKGFDARIERTHAQEKLEAGLARDAAAAAATTRTTGADASAVEIDAAATLAVSENSTKDPKRGFKSMGDFAQAVFGMNAANRNGVAIDKRLVPLAAAPSTFAGEGSGADGGILVPPGFSDSIFRLSLSEDSLLPLTDEMPVQGNNMLIPKDETTPWGSNGVRAYWQGEGTAGTPTKPVFGGMDLRLKKLLAFVPVSNELLADSTALGAYLPEKVADSLRWKTNEAILFGSGAGVPVGAMLGTAAIVQAKDSGQAASTVSVSNLGNMLSRLSPGSLSRAVWIINPSVMPALLSLTLGNFPVFLPIMSQSGAISGPMQWTLFGRPVMFSQHAKAFSSQGDVMLVDLKYYQSITKSEGVQMASSMHFYFDSDAMAFRTTFRMDGQPKIVAPISPANGSTTLSPFIQLQAR